MHLLATDCFFLLSKQLKWSPFWHLLPPNTRTLQLSLGLWSIYMCSNCDVV